MNHLAISAFLVFTTSFLNTLFLILHKPKTKLKKIWSYFNLAVGFWGFSFYKASMSSEHISALFWFRSQNLFAIFIPLFFFHFVLLLTDYISRKRRELYFYYILYVAYFIICFISPSSFVASTSPKLSIPNYLNAGPLYYPFPLLFFFMATYGLILLAKKYRSSSLVEKNQIKYVFSGTCVGFLGGGSTFFLVFDVPIYPWGTYLVPLYVITTTYAIIKHQLMDIRIVIKKSIIYSISIATISILYLLSIFILEKLAQKLFGYSSLTISIGTAFLLGLFFIPLRYKIQYFMDRYFFKGSTEEISNQNEQLRREITQSEKYKTLATLATGIAHEVKNPLTAIKTFSEYLPQRLDDKEFLKKFASIVGREVDRINDLIHQLLDYGKPAPLALKKTDINKLIENSADILNSKFIDQKIQVNKRFTSNKHLLNIDPNQIKQALLNILLNSIEAMPRGGELTISTSVTSTSYFVIKIEDTGGGISKEDLSQIFDPFFSTRTDGTGLGLSITQGLISNHKGIIQIKSKLGSGTIVRIDLPC